MDPESIIFYGDLFFNHIIYELGIHETMNLTLVNKKFSKTIINRIIDQLVWKINLFEGYDAKKVRAVITKKNIILTGNFLVSCIYDMCHKDKIVILNVSTYNPWKKGFHNSKYEDYEQHRFDRLMLKVQCVNNWEYEPISKLFSRDGPDKNMSIWLDRVGHVEGLAIMMGKQNSLLNLDLDHPFESKYSNYNFLDISRDHSYLKTFNDTDLHSEFNNFVKCIKRYEFKIYEIRNLQYFRNGTTGQLDNIVCQLVHLDDSTNDKEFGNKLYKYGRFSFQTVELKRSELCQNEYCLICRYGDITKNHYHFFDNKGYGEYAEYVFVEN